MHRAAAPLLHRTQGTGFLVGVRLAGHVVSRRARWPARVVGCRHRRLLRILLRDAQALRSGGCTTGTTSSFVYYRASCTSWGRRRPYAAIWLHFFGLSSGRRAVLAMRLYLLTMCPSPNSARLSCAQRNAPPHPPHYWYHRECSVVLAVLCSRFCRSIRN